jgi:16S rRNA (uracil1498-N3)-methyltransferase
VSGTPPRDRFFLEGAHGIGDRVAFASDDARKITTVLRMVDGDRVTAIDSAGRSWIASLRIEEAGVYATLETELPRGERELGTRVTIAQGIPKGQKMDLIVEKATELGVASIVPVRSARVIGERTGEHKRERWARIAKSAAQQSGRTVVPTVDPECDWGGLIASFPRYARVYIPWELADPVPLRTTFEREAPELESALFVIGPEGGLSRAEVDTAVAAGAVPISLGTRILRTETVALVVLAAFAYARGEL